MAPGGARREVVRRPAFQKARLIVVVDTEEEFDWSGGFHRDQTSVRAMDRIGLAQQVCDEFSGKPTYVVDFPIAAQERGFHALREYVDAGRASIGAHLHPWVSPPFEEELSTRNSFAGNLPRELEHRKIEMLTAQIEESFGRRPLVYKAGRYGIGQNTADILEGLGFEVDLSASPPYDFSNEGGPDFSSFTCDPYWCGDDRRVLGIPATGSYVGLLGARGSELYRRANLPAGRRLHLGAIVTRLRLVDRLHLSPEGFSFSELRRLTVSLLREGVRVFVFSLHSPSLEPGCTPYVRSKDDLSLLLERCRRYFDFFLEAVGGLWQTPLELKRDLIDSMKGTEH